MAKLYNETNPTARLVPPPRPPASSLPHSLAGRTSFLPVTLVVASQPLLQNAQFPAAPLSLPLLHHPLFRVGLGELGRDVGLLRGESVASWRVDDGKEKKMNDYVYIIGRAGGSRDPTSCFHAMIPDGESCWLYEPKTYGFVLLPSPQSAVPGVKF